MGNRGKGETPQELCFLPMESEGQERRWNGLV